MPDLNEDERRRLERLRRIPPASAEIHVRKDHPAPGQKSFLDESKADEGKEATCR